MDKLRRIELELARAETKIDCHKSEIEVLNLNIKHAKARKNLLVDVMGGLELKAYRLKQEAEELKKQNKR